jgi:hypothetical protein
MRPRLIAVALLVSLWTCMISVQADAQDDSACSNASLKGRYGFVLNGTIVGVGPIAIVGVAVYDGAGNWTRNETAVINGHVLPPESVPGTYSVNTDCTGSTLDAIGHHSQFAVVNHGKEILSLGTDLGSVITIDAKKQ